jgi:hypothetical protein
MWTNLAESDQAILWVVLLISFFCVTMRLLRVLELRSKKITVQQPDGSRLEFRGMTGTEAAHLNEAASQAPEHRRATADDVRR